MNPAPEVLDSLRKAVEAMPDDLALRLHLATMLHAAGLRDEMVRQVGAILQRDPGNVSAMALLKDSEDPRPRVPEQGQGGQPALPDRPASEFDWSQAESEVSDLLPPMFVGGPAGGQQEAADNPATRAFDVEQSGLRLADVAGMAEVKERLEAAFLARMRKGLKAYAGAAPVTRASGKTIAVLHRRVNNQRLAAAGYIWAFAARTASPGARDHYDRRKSAGDRHAAA